MKYVKLTSVDAEPMSLAVARTYTMSNLRPELDPKFSKEGYLIIDDEGAVEWYTQREFDEGVFVKC